MFGGQFKCKSPSSCRDLACNSLLVTRGNHEIYIHHIGSEEGVSYSATDYPDLIFFGKGVDGYLCGLGRPDPTDDLGTSTHSMTSRGTRWPIPTVTS